MPLPTRIGPGGPFIATPLPSSQAVATTLDDGDAWWAGQLGAVGASTALALSAALCLGLQQQTDELPLTAMRAGSEAFQVVAIGEAAPGYVFTADEEVPPQTLIVDHSDFPALQLPLRVALPVPVWAVEDELSLQPVALDDGSSWSVEAPRAAPVPLLVWDAGEAVGTVATAALEDGGDWSLSVDAQVTITIVNWPPTGGSAPVPPVVFGLDEDGWASPGQVAARTAPLLWAANDELPSAAAPVVAEDDSWQAPPRSLDRVLGFAVLADDELPVADVVAPSGSSNTSSGQRQFYQPLIVRWSVVDELPTPAAPLQVVESDWQVYTPAPLAPQPLHLPEPEELPAATLRGTPEEYYWQPLPPSFGTLLAPVVRADDEIVPPAPPLQLEPDYWPLQPLGRASYQASSLVSVEDEIVPQRALDEAYWQPPYVVTVPVRWLDVSMGAEDLTVFAILGSLARTYVVPVQKRVRVIAAQARTRVIALQGRIRVILAQYRSK